MIKCESTNEKCYKDYTKLSQPYPQTRKSRITREPYEQDNLSQVAHNAQIDQFWEKNLKPLQMNKEDPNTL